MSSSHTQVDTQVDAEADLAWDEHNLLSLDGGGVRGYWSLLSLEALMKEIGKEERRHAHNRREESHSFYPQQLPANYTQCEDTMPDNCEDPVRYHAQRYLPCHYFDLICGSSTGSLIAIMLSRFRMPVQDCLEEYRRMSNVIFGNPRWIAQRRIGIVKRNKYSASVMKTAFQEVTKRRDERPNDTEVDAPSSIATHEGTCSMFAVTERRVKTIGIGNSQMTHLLRSYYHSRKKMGDWIINFDQSPVATKLEVWLVARAATAAPMYFKEVKISLNPGEKVYYSDGGFGTTNNPTMLGKKELNYFYYRRDPPQDGQIGAIVSVGTARARAEPGGRGILQRIREAFSRSTDPEIVAQTMRDFRLPHYWRLNDLEGLNMELDDWRPRNSGQDTIRLMESRFREWVAKPESQRLLEASACELVKRRRMRMRDEAKWERFASVAEYTCECGLRQPFHFRDEFDAHFRDKHAPANENYCREPKIKRWEYPARQSSTAASNGFSRLNTGLSARNR